MIIPPAIEYVYAVGQDGLANTIKIGRSTDPAKRLSQMQVGHHANLLMLHAHACENNTWFEQALHTRFKKRHIRGEWYNVSTDEFIEACDVLEKHYAAMLAGEKLCDQLLLHRKKQGLTQQELAKKSGLRQATISKLECGSGGHIDTYTTLAATLGLTIVAQEVI